MSVDVPDCEGIPRRMWNTKCVKLYNVDGVLVGEGTIHSVDSELVLGASGPLGDAHMSVHVSISHSELDLPKERVYSLVAWPIELVHYCGASLQNHEARDNFNRLQAALLNLPSATSTRPYTSSIRNPTRDTAAKTKFLLTEESINLVSSNARCGKNCAQPFPRERIRAFHEWMYRNSTFKHRAFMKIDVHKHIHEDARRKKMVTIEGINVCLCAWMLIAGVAESTFYRYLKFMKANREARDHGNTRLLKPREHTQQATASLKCILDREADHMPHRTQSLKAGEKVVSKILLASFQWKDQLKKLNNTNAAFGLKEISTSNLSKIRSTKFSEFDVKKAGDNFARCATCDKLNELVKGAISGSQTAMKWMRRLDRHLTIARAHRNVYYINRDLSFNKPHECVTIIYDKMDHSKTACPAFSHKSKELDGLMKLPVSVTGILAHGHANVQYVHYGLDVFSHDSNYTIGSMAKLLRDLELPSKSSSRELFTNSKSTNLFKVVLEGADMCNASLPPLPNTLAPAMQLPPILNLQMDNATGDNKNRYVFCFWSLLVANKIFREVYVNFMIVDHMHDDIDALFAR